MENDTEVIRQQMAETRNSLSEKVEAVEELVTSAVKETTKAVSKTVENVTDAVEGTVNTVKDTVTDSVECVKNAFDISGYVDKYPWLTVGGCVAVGYTLGCLLGESNGHARKSGSTNEPSAAPLASSARDASPAEGHSRSSFLPDSWMPVIDKLKGLAIGTMSGVVGEMVMKAVPENIKSEVSQMFDDATQRLGGTPLRHE